MTAVLMAALAVQPGPDVGDLEQFRGLLAEAEASYSAAESVTRTTRYQWDGTVFQHDEHHEVTDGLLCRATVTGLPINGREGTGLRSAHGFNPAYQFGLERHRGGWRLSSLGSPQDEATGYYTDLQLTFAARSARHWDALARPDARPRFRPAVEWRGRPHPEWRFESATADGWRWLTALVLDPDRPGLVRVVRQSEAADPDRLLTELRVEYAASADRWPPPVRLEGWGDHARLTPQAFRLNSRHEVVSYRRLDPPPPAGTFTLSAFGLPEPAEPPTEPKQFPRPRDPNAPVEQPTPLDAEDEGRWAGWAIGGILLVGAVAFVLAGRQKA